MIPPLRSATAERSRSRTVSSGLAGETVNIDAMPCGATTFTRVASV
jgi:hypothetical protein